MTYYKDGEFFLEIVHERINSETLEVVEHSTTSRLEYSLYNIAKYERIHGKSFYSLTEPPTLIDIIKAICCNPEIQNDLMYLTKEDIEDIQKFLSWRCGCIKPKDGGGPRNNKMSSAKIYSMIFEYHMWPEVERWNINRLLGYISVMSDDRKPKKKGKK